MPAAALANVGLFEGWAALEDGWGDQMNANLRAVDLLLQARVIARDLATPPATPTNGDAYVVPTGASGAWAGQATKIARWCSTLSTPAWEFYTPKTGWVVWVINDAAPYRFSAGAWADASPTIASISGLQAALDAKASALVAINNQTGTTYTYTTADPGRVVRANNAAAITHTLPTNASAAIPVGASIPVRQVGAGQVTISPAGGVTLNVPTGFQAKTGRVGAVLMLHKVAADEWDLTGDLAAV